MSTMSGYLRTKLVAFLLLSALLCGCSESLFYRASEDDFNKWVLEMDGPNLYTTAKNIADWMKVNMKYEPDGILDYFKPWRRAWNQTGDCEDFSGVALECLHRLGHTQFVYLSVFYDTADGSGGHTVCTDGRLHLSNWGLYSGFNGMEDVVHHVSSNRWSHYRVRDRSLTEIRSVKR